MAARARARPSVVVARPALTPFAEVVRDDDRAIVATDGPERELASLGRPVGWFLRLLFRLALIGVVLVVLLAAAMYMLARSLY